MMLKPALVAIALAIAGSASAQFAGPSVRGQATTVAQVDRARLGSYVTLTGNIVAHERGDFYTFRDSSGDIRVEIAPDTFAGRTIRPETNVRIMGEVDRGIFGRYIWVKTLELL